MKKEPPVYLNAKQAAEFLTLSELTLRNWRKQGIGPRYCKFGRRVTYEKAELAAWARAQTRTSTSEP